MHNRRNTIQRKHLPNTKHIPAKRQQMPNLILGEDHYSSRFVTNNKRTKKIARLLVALLALLVIVLVVMSASGLF